MHESLRNAISLFDMCTNSDIGVFTDPAQSPVLPGKEVRVYQSLWMDIGRIVVLFSDGDVAIVVPATDEAIKNRNEKRAKQEKLAKELQAKQLEEEMSKKMSKMEISPSEKPVGAKADTPMGDEKTL